MDRAELQAALNDPYSVCAALGLCPGPGVHERGEWWYTGRSDITIRCPWHGGRACHVRAYADGIGFACFNCGEKGSVFKLVAKTKGIADTPENFRDVLNETAALVGVRLDPPEGTELTAATTDPKGSERLDPETFAEVADTLLKSGLTSLERHADRGTLCDCGCVEARRYLEDRCILASALEDGWRHLPFGYRDLNLLRDLIIDHHGVEAWRRSGLSQRQNPDRWFYGQNRLVIPWRGLDGRVWQIQRRLLRAPTEGTKEERYLSATSADRGAAQPYGAHRLPSDATPVAFVEGAFDALSLGRILDDRRDAGEARWTVLGLPGVGVWRTSWAMLARDREAVVAFDHEVKVSAGRGVNNARAKALRDLAPLASRLSDCTPELDGTPMHDWNDVWCRIH